MTVNTCIRNYKNILHHSINTMHDWTNGSINKNDEHERNIKINGAKVGQREIQFYN